MGPGALLKRHNVSATKTAYLKGVFRLENPAEESIHPKHPQGRGDPIGKQGERYCVERGPESLITESIESRLRAPRFPAPTSAPLRTLADERGVVDVPDGQRIDKRHVSCSLL